MASHGRYWYACARFVCLSYVTLVFDSICALLSLIWMIFAGLHRYSLGEGIELLTSGFYDGLVEVLIWYLSRSV
jgi:hypothetical protein